MLCRLSYVGLNCASTALYAAYTSMALSIASCFNRQVISNSNSNSNDKMSMLPPTQRPVAHYNVNVRINN